MEIYHLRIPLHLSQRSSPNQQVFSVISPLYFKQGPLGMLNGRVLDQLRILFYESNKYEKSESAHNV